MTDNRFIKEGEEYAQAVRGGRLPRNVRVYMGDAKVYRLESLPRMLNHIVEATENKKTFKRVLNAIYTDIATVNALLKLTDLGMLKPVGPRGGYWLKQEQKTLENTCIMVNALRRKYSKVYGGK
jgi:hypothetical protein